MRALVANWCQTQRGDSIKNDIKEQLGQNFMKQTYTKKYFDVVLITFSLLFFLDSVVNLFDKFEYFSSYILRIIWMFCSVVSLISLITTKLNGERYSRFFIIINLIAPPILVLAQFLADLLFYGAGR